jgi:O-acetyl-ADP-ribose deacetylase (regulator of RNase III)
MGPTERRNTVQSKIGTSILELVQGDITTQDTEAIVNAANPGLLGGGGVDGAIHRAGGPQILEECRRLGGCPPGQARITSGGRLRARYVIHTVGPVYYGGNRDEAAILADAYRNSLALASERGIRSVAFPSLSTGAYGYPLELAAAVALSTAISYLREHQDIKLVRFVLYGSEAYRAYEKALAALTSKVA